MFFLHFFYFGTGNFKQTKTMNISNDYNDHFSKYSASPNNAISGMQM